MTLNSTEDYAIDDAEDFIVSARGDVSAISAEIDHSQTRREHAERMGWTISAAFERAYEQHLRKEIQQ